MGVKKTKLGGGEESFLASPRKSVGKKWALMKRKRTHLPTSKRSKRMMESALVARKKQHLKAMRKGKKDP